MTSKGDLMENTLPSVIDLVVLKKEVLDKGLSAALPCNLPDFWLDKVADSLKQVLENPSPESGRYLAGPLAIVIHLLLGRSTSAELEVSHARLYECLRAYRIEVALEAVNRSSNIRTTSASLETIFTDRHVTSTLA
jgi:hypothetical protein